MPRTHEHDPNPPVDPRLDDRAVLVLIVQCAGNAARALRELAENPTGRDQLLPIDDLLDRLDRALEAVEARGGRLDARLSPDERTRLPFDNPGFLDDPTLLRQPGFRGDGD